MYIFSDIVELLLLYWSIYNPCSYYFFSKLYAKTYIQRTCYSKIGQQPIKDKKSKETFSSFVFWICP